MNLILVEAGELIDGIVSITGRRAEHIATVIRPAVGDRLRLGIINGDVGVGRVRTVSKMTVTLDTIVLELPPILPATELVLAVPRPKVLARVISAAASLGVGHIDLINSWRVEKAYFGSPVLSKESLMRAVRLGCEQGGLTRLPKVAVHRRFMQWIESLEPAANELRLFADPRAQASLRSLLPIESDRSVRICVGPEGGWIDVERASLSGAGFAPLSIGRTVVKVETAVASVLGQIELCRG